MFNENLKFKESLSKSSKTHDFNEFLNDIFCLKLAFNETKMKELEIYTENTYLFLIAFFGAILADLKIYVLPKKISSGERPFFDDLEVLKLLQKQSKNSTKFPNDKDLSLNLNKIFFIQTSGSSGERKNIAKSIAQMVLEARFLQKEFNISTKYCFFSSVSHQHLYGLTFKVFLPLVSGTEVVCANLNYPEAILENLETCNCENLVFLSSPVFLDTIARHNRVKDFGVISKIFTAGSKLAPKIHIQLLEFLKNTQLIEIYGSTETGVIAKNLGEGFKIFSEVKTSINKDSRLIVRSPWINLKDGFLSNDCVEINNDCLNILGRYDRIIKLHDKRTSLDEIEQFLEKSELVKKVVSLQDEKTRLSAILVLSPKGWEIFRKFGKKRIVQDVLETLQGDFKNQVRHFYIREKLPYDAQGKLSKSELLDCIQAKIEPEFTLLEKTCERLCVSSQIPPDCFYFNGHFLNFPLVPGFVELSFIYRLLKEYFGILVSDIDEILSVKFMQFLRPKDSLKIEITKKENKIYFKMFANDKECSNGRMHLI